MTIPSGSILPTQIFGQPGLPARTLYTSAFIRPTDIRHGDLIKFQNSLRTWREVVGFHVDHDEVVEMYGEDSDFAQESKDKLDHVGEFWVMVRYLVPEASAPHELNDRIVFLHTLDLIEVQVPLATQEGTPSA